MYEDRGGKPPRAFCQGKGAYLAEPHDAQDGAYYPDAAYLTYQNDGGGRSAGVELLR